MKKLLNKILLCLFLILGIHNCSELTFRSDPLSMTMVKYENRSPNKYIFLGHEGDDCHLLRHKRIHNFFFFFPLNTFSKEEIQEISQQKMIRYKNIMRLGDFAWTLFLLPATILTYSIEVETCNTGMVAVTRKDPLYLESLKNNKPGSGSPKDDSVARLEEDTGKSKKNNSGIIQKSINPKPERELERNREPKRQLRFKERIEPEEPSEIESLDSKEIKNENPANSENNSIIANENKGKKDTEVKTKKKKKKDSNSIPEVDPNLPPETVWDSAIVSDETSENSSNSEIEEAKEPFNPEIYKLDGTLPIIWNYKNSITNRINENVKPFSILFSKNGTELSEEEEKKLDAFAAEYLESYGTSKILLIGHSEWAKGKGVKLTLSQHRAEAVRNYLIQKKVPTENILLTFSGGLWGETNEQKFGKNFSRRVDIVFLY